MKDFGLLLMSAALLACGFAAAWWAQDLRAADMRNATAVIVSDNSELRDSAKALRQRCPARSRFQRAPLTKGLVV